MKFCVDFYKQFRYNDIIDEVIYDYTLYGDYVVDRIEKAEWKPEQRIILDITNCNCEEVEVIPTIQMCIRVHENFAVRLKLTQLDIGYQLLNLGIPFFYDEHFSTMDGIYGAVQRGVSDVYATEGLGFRLKDIGEYCHKNNVKVRIIPNVAQYKPGFKDDIPDLYKFFVRPEDVEFYEGDVDVFEFIAPADRTSVLYEIYKNGRWLGDLGELIIGLNEPLENTVIAPIFGQGRKNCGQKCLIGKCYLCNQVRELGELFNNYNLEMTRGKNEDWYRETDAYKKAMQICKTTAKEFSTKIPEETGIHTDSE